MKRGKWYRQWLAMAMTVFMLVMLLPAVGAHAEDKEDLLTLHITNILYNTGASVNGHAVAYESTMTMVKGQSKKTTGVFSMVGGANRTANGMGYSYRFLNAFVLADAESGPVLTESDSVEGFRTVERVRYTDTDRIQVEYTGGTSETFEGRDLYLSPIYKAVPDWYLNYYYVDNLSTGSGSWSNRDAVTEYAHTFREPDGVEHYRFCWWWNSQENKQYQEGDTATYTSAEIPHGTTKDVYVYAMWQPSVTVNYYGPDGTLVKTVEEFENDITVYSFTLTDEEDTRNTFAGWYTEEGDRLEEDHVCALPDISYTADAYSVNVYARFTTSRSVVKEWDDEDDRDGIRPDSLTVTLFADDTAVSETSLEASGKWQASFSDLPAWKDGKRVTYTVSEDEADGYEMVSCEEEGDTFTLTNRHIPEETAFAVLKEWDDADDEDGLRPESVVVQLFADDEPFGESVVLTEDDQWAYSWEGLYRYRDEGTPIVYRAEEIEVPDEYTAEAVSAAGVTTITNTHVPYPVYTVTVNYLDEENTALQTAYTVSLKAGNAYDVTDQAGKTISGYEYLRTEGTVSGTVQADVTVNVYYRRIPEPTEPVTEEPTPGSVEEEIPDESVPLAPPTEKESETQAETGAAVEEIEENDVPLAPPAGPAAPAQPTRLPMDHGYEEIIDDTVPQALPVTGQLYWPIALLVSLGVLLLAVAAVIRRKNHEA